MSKENRLNPLHLLGFSPKCRHGEVVETKKIIEIGKQLLEDSEEKPGTPVRKGIIREVFGRALEQNDIPTHDEMTAAYNKIVSDISKSKTGMTRNQREELMAIAEALNIHTPNSRRTLI